MSRRRYNKSQRRDKYGRWSNGGISTKPARRTGTGGSGAYKGRTTKKYAAYQARLASEKKAKRKATVKKVALGAAAIGLIAAGGYVGVKSNQRRVPSITTMKAGKGRTNYLKGAAPAMIGPAPTKRQRGNKNSAPSLGTLAVAQTRQKMLTAAPIVSGAKPKGAKANIRTSVATPKGKAIQYRGTEKQWTDPLASVPKVATLKAGAKKGKAAKDESPDIWTQAIPIAGTYGSRGRLKSGTTARRVRSGDVSAGPDAVRQVKKATSGRKVTKTLEQQMASSDKDWQAELKTMTREERRQWRELNG